MPSRIFTLTPYTNDTIIGKSYENIQLNFDTNVYNENWNDSICIEHAPQLPVQDLNQFGREIFISWVAGTGTHTWQPLLDISTNEGKIFRVRHDTDSEKIFELRAVNDPSNQPFFMSYNVSNAMQFKRLILEDINGNVFGGRVTYDFRTDTMTGTDNATSTIMPDKTIRIPINPLYQYRIITILHDINDFDEDIPLNTKYNFIGDIVHFRVVDQNSNVIGPTNYTNGFIAPYNEDFTELRGLPRNIVDLSSNDINSNLGTSIAIGLSSQNENIKFRFKHEATQKMYNTTINGGTFLQVFKQDEINGNSIVQQGLDNTTPIEFAINLNEPIEDPLDTFDNDVSLNTSYLSTGVIDYFQIYDLSNNMISPIHEDNGQIVPYASDYSEMRGLPREPLNQVGLDNYVETNMYGTALTTGLASDTEFISYRFKHSNTNALYNTTISGDSITLSGDSILMQVQRLDDIANNTYKSYGTVINPIKFFVDLASPIEQGLEFVEFQVFEGYNLIGTSQYGLLSGSAIKPGTLQKFEYNNGGASYQTITSRVLEPNVGYWVDISFDSIIKIQFDPIFIPLKNNDFIEFQVFEGYNLIGTSQSGLLSGSAIKPGTLQKFEYNNGGASYQTITSRVLEPNVGYWVDISFDSIVRVTSV